MSPLTPGSDRHADAAAQGRGEEPGAPEDFDVRETLRAADEAASVAHDFIHGLNGVTREQANAAIWEIAHLDICGAVSCDIYDPEFPPCVCSLPAGHDGMHREPGVCRWREAEPRV